MPSAQGTGLLLKGYRYDRWDCGSNVRCAAPFGHRQNVCVCFTFVKLLLISIGKASPAGSFLLSIPSLSALAMKEPRLGESLLGQGERNQGLGQKGDPFYMFSLYLNLLFPSSFTLKDRRRWRDQLYVLIKY